MSKELPSTLWRRALLRSSLPDKTKLVGFAIAERAYGNKDYAYPSYQTIKQDTGITTDETIRRHTKKLEDAGWVAVSKVSSPKGKHNRYTLLVPQALSSFEEEVSSFDEEVSSFSEEVSMPWDEVEETTRRTKVEVPKEETKEHPFGMRHQEEEDSFSLGGTNSFLLDSKSLVSSVGKEVAT